MRTFGIPVDSRRIGSFTFSLTRYAAGSELPWHEHSDPYLTFVVDGAYRESLRGDTRDCRSRSIVYHPAGERHADQFGARPASCLDVRFDSAWLHSVDARGCAIARPAMLYGHGFASRMEREFQQPDGLSEMVIEGLLLELFAEKERTNHAGKPPAWLRGVRDLLESQLKPVALKELAAAAGVHPTHLTRVFRTHYGCTIGEFVRARRIERSREQVRAGRALAGIAADLGFSDQSHFSREFRRVTGQTPGAYRRTAR